MSAKAVCYILAALVLGFLAVANWPLFASPVELNLLATRVQAPLVILVLIVVGVISLLDLGIHASSFRAWVRERRTLKENLEAARLRAEHEEESRIGALRAALERELAAIRATLDQLREGQSTLLASAARERRTDPRPMETLRSPEPELIPPRTASDVHRQ